LRTRLGARDAEAPRASPSPRAAPTRRGTRRLRPARKPDADATKSSCTQRVLADLQRQVELMLEVRLREALAPILARASDALGPRCAQGAHAAMRDIVARSIARELGRREDR
jgi:hypothetical protein